MSIRNTALAWLRDNHHVTHGDIFTSKLFIPQHSRTGHHAWWIRLPIERLSRDYADFIHIVCEMEPGKHDFHYLKIPRTYLVQHQHQFGTIGKDKLNLFLSAQPENFSKTSVATQGSGLPSFWCRQNQLLITVSYTSKRPKINPKCYLKNPYTCL